ncbi:unnamed protein product [Musa acuminata subsp. malaccensis]|uniref:(wild Malaysian banana) hypothetical protein n=1 Tax=Musa acuminata subsp. malaccensis TaxID=214687 RepID=A0A804JXE1_MUSAM|nr:unnamed protein product [Musa acuminata subsp. malaccensis]
MHLRCWRGAVTARSDHLCRGFHGQKPVGVLPVHASQSCAEQVQHLRAAREPHHRAQRLAVDGLPLLVVVWGCVFVYLVKAEDHGIQLAGPSNEGLNPVSITDLKFQSN